MNYIDIYFYNTFNSVYKVEVNSDDSVNMAGRKQV